LDASLATCCRSWASVIAQLLLPNLRDEMVLHARLHLISVDFWGQSFNPIISFNIEPGTVQLNSSISAAAGSQLRRRRIVRAKDISPPLILLVDLSPYVPLVPLICTKLSLDTMRPSFAMLKCSVASYNASYAGQQAYVKCGKSP
jgi:hypothetical protein